MWHPFRVPILLGPPTQGIAAVHRLMDLGVGLHPLPEHNNGKEVQKLPARVIESLVNF